MHLIIIDPQNDFMDFLEAGDGQPASALPVLGARADMDRLAAFIDRNRKSISQITVTMDTHSPMQIFHPPFWVDAEGRNPEPNTVITEADILAGRWRPVDGGRQAYANGPDVNGWVLHYVRELAKGGRELRIWPLHCLEGTWGHEIYQPLQDALMRWSYVEDDGRLVVPYTILKKGIHPLTEQYGVLQAEVPVPGARETELNMSAVRHWNGAAELVFAGEAGAPFCLTTSVDQYLVAVDPSRWRKTTILRDCVSPVLVPGIVDFTPMHEEWMARMEQRGHRIVTTEEYHAYER